MEEPKITQVGIKSGSSQAHDEAHEPMNSIETCLLNGCAKNPQSSPTLLQQLGYETRTDNFKAALKHLLARGHLEMTLPDKPRSKNQRYRITSSGRNVLETIKKERQP
jgi:ATP-dependent DNA helicase RecG